MLKGYLGYIAKTTQNIMREFSEKQERIIDRLFEMIPGLMTWAFLLSPIWLGLLFPPAIIYLLAFLTIYWCYMAAKQTAGLMIGYPKYQEEIATDWWKKCQELNWNELPDPATKPTSLENVKHFIVIPVVNEPEDVLRPAIDALYNQTFPTNRICLIYSIEERFGDEVEATIKKVMGERINEFYRVFIFRHPAGIVGEAIGSGGGNRTWGATHAVEILKQENATIKDFIFTNLDADHVLHERYLARLTYAYLLETDRNNKFFATAVHLFNNNHWNVPSMARIESNFVTMGTLAHRSIFWSKNSLTTDTFAAFSNSLQTLIDANYWDVASGADDTTYFWRAFFARNGYFRAVKHYVPYSADAVEGESFYKAHKSLYKQLLRWGWGVVEVPISLKGFVQHKNIPLSTKLLWIYDHIKTRIFMINIVFLITFGFGILTLVNPNVKQSSFAYLLPDIMSVILTVTLIFLLPAAYYRAKLTPDIPKNWPLWKKLVIFAEGFVVIINLLTFSFFPLIEAQTRMLFGKKMKDLYHTPKMRTTKDE